jgi:hypothetical protein
MITRQELIDVASRIYASVAFSTRYPEDRAEVAVTRAITLIHECEDAIENFKNEV